MEDNAWTRRRAMQDSDSTVECSPFGCMGLHSDLFQPPARMVHVSLTVSGFVDT